MTPYYLLLATALAADPTAADRPVTAAAARAFPTRIQPILANLCSACHARPDHPSGLKLRRIAEGYADANATDHNLWAAARFVRADDPSSSPLLVMAATPHGGRREAPLRSRMVPAYRHLEAWAAGVFPPPVAPAASPQPVATPSVPSTAPPPAGEPLGPPAGPADPFDPAAFNRPGWSAGTPGATGHGGPLVGPGPSPNTETQQWPTP